MAVALGGRDAPLATLRVADYAAYFRLVKARFEAIALRDEPPAYPPSATYPDPVEHCEVCRWRLVCAHRRRADDDLSLVAGISARQKRELRARGVATRRRLARLPVPLTPPPEHGTAQAWERVREQARIQVEGEDAGRHLYELLEPSRLKDGALEPDRGLLVLPEPSPGDLFFDIEGDPFVDEEGLEYLFGVIEPGLADADGGPTYHAFWATDRDGEKAAFEHLIDLVVARLERDPGLHVYHYAPYEPSAVKRLMGRYGTREPEVDRLLRGGIFVDLFRAVRQGLRASVESYSIKRLEPLYDFARQIDLRDAGSSIVAFEAWLEEGGSEGGDQAALDRIAGYNRDDCLSNWRLRDWLEGRRAELAMRIGELLPRPAPRSSGSA
jgi:uncharacterized protein